MDEKPFSQPRIALNRIYTRQGDGGDTMLAGGRRIAKDAARIECYGTVDELSAFIGQAAESARSVPALEPLARILARVQHELFNLGSQLATLPADRHPKQARIFDSFIERLEREMDEANESLAPLRSFVLPGGSRVAAELHICRTVCRRAERTAVRLGREESLEPEIVRYLNRLSDAIFVWSRWANFLQGAQETLWDPNAAT